MAQIISGDPGQSQDTAQYVDRIKRLTANHKEDDPMWWNDLAVAHMRLEELRKAVELLEPASKRFTKDYGVHANLGTAYYLLGRYADAEKEIARDLEINPEAHLGLEKYHLALLQFLARDQGYQSRHLYVDEFTPAFLESGILLPRTTAFSGWPQTNGAVNRPAELTRLENEYRQQVKTNTNAYELGLSLLEIVQLDAPQPYTTQWDLAKDPKLKEGLMYMANMNPKEPACFQMLGVLCLLNRDRHLAVAAFEKAIALGSPQKEVLQAHVDLLKKYIEESKAHGDSMRIVLVFGLVLLAGGLLFAVLIFKKVVNWFSRPSIASGK